jgi:hypothetical protein
MEKDIYRNFENGSFTQVDLIKLILHNAQHMATREDVKNDILKSDNKLDKVEVSLTYKIDKLETKVDKIDNKFDRLQWLIISTILVVLLKDYVIELFTKMFV